MTEERDLVSLVLATIGRTQDLGRCLRSLATQSDMSVEVLVVDQNPDDRLVPYIAEATALGLMVRHLRMSRPSLSGARNLGIQESRGAVIGFPDDDCWYEPDVIKVVRENLSPNAGLGGVVACWVEQSSVRGSAAATGELALEQWRRFRGGDASSISLFFRKSLFDQLNGFDERFGIGKWYGAGEETDLVLRALALGARVAHCPAARVHHAFGKVGNEPIGHSIKNARRRARGTGALYAKHSLTIWVILRGLTAPSLKPVLQLAGVRAIAMGLATSLGRLEGFVRWSWGHS